MLKAAIQVVMKILVVHRQKEVIEQIKSVLRNNEPIIRFSDSGLDGLLVARVEPFDLVICSTDLPVITGFELVRSIRTNSINKNVPVIFLADQLDEKVEHLGNALGVTGMLPMKDVDDQLANMVGKEVVNKPDRDWFDLLPN